MSKQQLKRGTVSAEERAFVVKNKDKLSPTEIAQALNRSVELVCGLLDEERVTRHTPERAAIRDEFRLSERYTRLTKELSRDELAFFEEEYMKLVGQLQDGNDVLPSEETQITDVIKFDILKSRNMVARRRALDDIARLENVLEQFWGRFPDPASMQDTDRAFINALDLQLRQAREAEQDRSGEYVKLQERQDALMKSLKSTRDQRFKEVTNTKETVLSLLKKLMRDEKVRAQEGRETALVELASLKERRRLGQEIKYEDGGVDRPILSADTVDIED